MDIILNNYGMTKGTAAWCYVHGVAVAGPVAGSLKGMSSTLL